MSTIFSLRLREISTVGEGLPKVVITRIQRHYYGRLRSCYEQALKRKASLAGVVTVQFVIDEVGIPTTPSATSSGYLDPVMNGCILGVFRGMQFPPPAPGTVSVVTKLQLRPTRATCCMDGRAGQGDGEARSGQETAQ